MTKNPTKIPWCDVTLNPLPGCQPVSEGCAKCYAVKMAKRLRAMGVAAYQDVLNEDVDAWSGRIGQAWETMRVMTELSTPKSIFVQSMGDLFYKGISDQQRDKAFSYMLRAPQHRWLVLTKRPETAYDYYAGIQADSEGASEPNPLDHARNIWLGTTIELEKYLWRAQQICTTPVAHRFVSAEPLLGSLDLRPYLKPNWMHANGKIYPGLDWVIVGCEQIRRRPGRECRLNWVKYLVEQCREAHIPVPVFVKQIVVDDRVIHEPQEIADALGCTPAEIRQVPPWPEKSGKRK